jgi:hypothetical protein
VDGEGLQLGLSARLRAASGMRGFTATVGTAGSMVTCTTSFQHQPAHLDNYLPQRFGVRIVSFRWASWAFLRLVGAMSPCSHPALSRPVLRRTHQTGAALAPLKNY